MVIDEQARKDDMMCTHCGQYANYDYIKYGIKLCTECFLKAGNTLENVRNKKW